jgi:hypothetical protein
MLKSAQETTSREKLSRRETTIAVVATEATTTTYREWSRWTTPKSCLGSRWISTARVESS